MRTDIAIMIFMLYSLVVSITNFVHVLFFVPILLELYRNKDNLLSIFKKIAYLNILLIIIAISLYFSNPKLAFLIFIRSNFIMIFGLLLFNKKSYFDIAFGLKRLKVPDIIVSIFYFTSKFIIILKDEIKIFQQNLLLRGFEAKTDMFTYQTYANFIGLLFINSFYKADRLSNILITRGYNGKIYSLKAINPISKYEIIVGMITIISLILGYYL